MRIGIQGLVLLATLAWPVAALSAQNQAPTVIAPPAPVDLGGALGNIRDVGLDTIFADPDLLQLAGTQVRFGTTLGTMSLELFDTDAPLTVQNFLHYIQTGRMKNVVWHRAVRSFIIQTGGYTFGSGHFTAVPVYPPVVNEFHYSNTRGTVAMAKVAGDPNSATSQWFVNLADNSANLDVQNGGFTVFGRVIQGTMSVADSISFARIIHLAGDFGDLPVRNYAGGNLTAANLFTITSIATGPKMSFSVSVANPQVATASVQGVNLHLVAGTTGTTTLTLKATDFDGLFVQTTLQVTVAIVPQLLSITQDVQGTHVTFRGMPNTTYEIDSIDDMSGSSWQVLNAGLVSAADGTIVFVDQPPGGARFYRARQLP